MASIIGDRIVLTKLIGWFDLKGDYLRVIKIFSFFSGIGFLDLGFETENYKIVHVNEYHEAFLQAYKSIRNDFDFPEPQFGYSGENFNEYRQEPKKTWLKKKLRDARQNGDIVGFIAGPPCPDFSIGGKNKGRLGEKGKLTKSYLEVISSQRPDFFLFENVKGLWKTKRHRKFYEEVKRNIQNSGFITTEKVINSLSFGVPQDRDRVFLIGFNIDTFPKLKEYTDSSKVCLQNGTFPWKRHFLYDLENVMRLEWPERDPFKKDSVFEKPDEVIEELTVEYWFRKNDVTNHPNAEHHFQPRGGLPKFQSIEEGDDSGKSFKRLHRWRYSPTAAYGNNEVHLHPYKVRRISAAEAMAIQSLPADFCLPDDMTLTDMFKAIGNGVPYLMSKAIAKTIKDFLEEYDKS